MKIKYQGHWVINVSFTLVLLVVVLLGRFTLSEGTEGYVR